VTQIKTYSWDNAQVILVGNKCDMEDERVISYERGKQLAEQLGIEFFETSAKENINVKVTLRNNSLLNLRSRVSVQGKYMKLMTDLRFSQ
jgi:GTPase SAR1 family protein